MSRYQCDQCGACCSRLIVEIYPFDIEREPRLEPVAKPYKEPSMEGHSHVLSCLKPCPMLTVGVRDSKCSCLIYPTRPTDCVMFQAGSKQCQELRQELGLPPLEPISSCPQ